MDHGCSVKEKDHSDTNVNLVATNDGSIATDNGSTIQDGRLTPMKNESTTTDNVLPIDAPLEHYYQVVQNPLCDVCDRPAQWLCGRCKSIRYCSRKCQLIASRCHKGLCATFQTIHPVSPDIGRNGRNRYVALINSEGINIRDIEFTPVTLRDGKRYIAPSQNMIWGAECLGEDFPVPEFRSSLYVGRSYASGDNNTEWKRPLSRRLVFMTRSLVDLKYQGTNFLCDYGFVNSETVHAFGPAVLYVTSVDGESPLDITAGDIHHFKEILRDNLLATSEVDYALEKYMEYERVKKVESSFVEGLRINCKGDQSFNHRPRFEPVLIPSSSITEKSEDLRPPIAQKLKIPIMTHVIKRDRNYSCKDPFKSLNPRLWNNEIAIQLLQECDFSRNQWTSMLYNSLTSNGKFANLNSIIFVRNDKVPLTADLVEGIINYSLDAVRPRFEEIMNMEDSYARDRAGMSLLRDIDLELFARYYEQWLKIPRECRRHPDTYPWLRATPN